MSHRSIPALWSQTASHEPQTTKITMPRKKSKSEKRNTATDKTKANFWRILFALFAILLFLSLVSQHSGDLNVINGGSDAQIQNWIGLIGAYLSKFILLLFGIGSYIFSLVFLYCSIQAFFPHPYYKRKGFFISMLSLVLGVSILFGMFPQSFASITNYLGIGSKGSPYYALSGGIIGQFLAAPAVTLGCKAGLIRRYIGTLGTAIMGLGLLTAGTIVLWRIETLHLLYKLLIPLNILKRKNKNEDFSQKAIEQSRKNIEERRNKQREEADLPDYDELLLARPTRGKKVETPSANLNKNIIPTAKQNPIKAPFNYKLPPVNLLKDLPETKGDSQTITKESIETLQDTLNSFGIDARVAGVVTGPRVTRLEVIPSPGVRVQKISSLESNIKLDLKAESIRILAPIPGKDAVGIEVPNKSSSLVSLKTILTSKQWEHNNGGIPIVLGRDVAGIPIITDLARAPHLLIAGATGSGKSVCVNTLIMSLLYKFSPDELRLIMVDPKVVEFEMYQKLPHLITPIVNEPKKVPLVLRWTINEMEKRYRTLAKVRVKNLEGFNSRSIPAEPILDDEGEAIPNRLPFIVIIIDELADIMMVAKADVETSIARIAQKARAVGIHLVLATQRPSVQIITGIIKANLPTRIAFRVTSVVDSRVILDHKGAESLLGRGDMLFIPPGSAKLDRIQGAMLSDPEIEEIVSFCSAQMEQAFNHKVFSQDTENTDSSIDSTKDYSGDNSDSEEDLLHQAIDIVRRERKASTSYLQRRLKIGYNRAAELIDTMEAEGIIGPQIGSARREILIDSEEN